MIEIILVSILLPLAATALVQVPQSGGYNVRQGETEISRERYHFDGSVLADTVDLRGRGLRLATEMVLRSPGDPASYRSDVINLASGEMVQRLEVSFAATAANWTVTGAGAQSGSTPITAPYAMMQNPAFAQLAVTLLGLDPELRETQRVNMWVPEGARVVELAVDYSNSTSGTATLAGVVMEFSTDDAGWLRHVTIPAQNVAVEWSEEAVATPPAGPAGSADTLPPPTVAEESYSFSSADGFVLRGTLASPIEMQGPVPVGVIIAGSGATDRNCNAVGQLRTNTYAQLAWGLAERGIATLRYDKRGVGESSGDLDPSLVTFDLYAGDVAAAVEVLSRDDRFSEIVLIGHSEGAGLAVRAANGGAPVSGVISLAGMGRPFLEVLRGQLAEQLDDEMMTQFDHAMQLYLRGEDPADVPALLSPLFRPVNRRFTQTLASYRPTEEVLEVPVPLMIVQGATDFQVSVEDADLLAAARPDAREVVIPAANHVFKRAPERSRASQTMTYLDPTLPIVPEVVDLVSEWIHALR